MKKIFFSLLLTACAANGFVFAENLNFNFQNPSFIGGNVNNAASLLNLANTQNKFTAPALSPAEKFETNLQNAIFAKIQSNILNPGANPFGDYETVNYKISVIDSGNGKITIKTIDKTTQAQTEFTVDNYGAISP
jgi:curli production assembly/transport component CsgF